MVNKRHAAGLVLVCAWFVAGCVSDSARQTAESTAAVEPLTVYTVNYPLAYFATRIGGDNVNVEFPAPPDGDPANWAPSGQDIAAFQQADLILLNGAGYARWTKMVSLPAQKSVDTSARFADRYIVEEGESHSHGAGDEHAHEAEAAITTWLDPLLAIEQAASIRDALIARRPASADAFRTGFDALEADLRALDADFDKLFGTLGDAPLVFSHPVYQYLERRYDINGISVHWEPDEPPGNEELMNLAERLIRHPARMMVWEGEPTSESVSALKGLGVDSVALDPCGNRPASGDYLSVMRTNVANLRAVTSR